MDTDFSKLFLFLVLALVVLVMVTNKARPLAAAPLEPSTPTDDVNTEPSSITRGPGWANVPNYQPCPPLSLMMPVNGTQPYAEGGL